MNLLENLFELDDYFKLVRVNSFYSNNYIENQSNGDKNKTLSLEEYLEEIKPFLKHIIKNLKKLDNWKIQLISEINFISSTDPDEEQLMYSYSENMEIMINDKADKVNRKCFGSIYSKHQNNLERSRRRQRFCF